MTKSETREVTLIVSYHKAGLDADYVARALSALIRAARSQKSIVELKEYAQLLGVTNNPEFIC